MERMLEVMVDDTVNDVNKEEEDTILARLDNTTWVNSVKIEHVEAVAAVLRVNEEVETSHKSVVGNHQKTVSVVVHRIRIRIHED
jgi:hypothetical protein